MLSITSAIFPAYYNTVTKVNGSTIVEIMGMKFRIRHVFHQPRFGFWHRCLDFPLRFFRCRLYQQPPGFHAVLLLYGVVGLRWFVFFGFGGATHLGLAATLIATVGYAGSIVFYNSYLPAIVTEDRIGRARRKRVFLRLFWFHFVSLSTLR